MIRQGEPDVPSQPPGSSPEVGQAAAYHVEVVARLDRLLGEDLIGVYAGGSFALGDYVPGRSDLDVAAVSRVSIPSTLKMEIAEALRHESLPCPARGLEFVLYPESSVREATAEAGFELNLNTGRAMTFVLETDPTAASRHWFVIDRAILREHGRTLHGPPARELFAPIPRETLLCALIESVHWHEASEDAREDDNAVLNACRAWRFASEGVWSSKREAASWGRTRVGDPDLVTRALEVRSSNGQLDRERVAAFLRGVRRLLESAT